MAKRKKSASSDPVVENRSEEVITYTVFFHDCLSKGMVKPWQEREIQAFFRDLGLTDKEPLDKYADGLKKF